MQDIVRPEAGIYAKDITIPPNKGNITNLSTAPSTKPNHITLQQKRLPIKLTPLNTNSILTHRHPQILHGKHRTSLSRTPRATTAKSSPLDPQVGIRLPLTNITPANTTTSGCSGTGSRSVETRGGVETAHGVTGGGAVGGADARILV